MKPKKIFHSLEDLDQISGHREIPAPASIHQHDGKAHLRLTSSNFGGQGKSVHVKLDTHGRKGKRVTLVIGLQHNPDTMEEIARILKQHCGSGGTVKEGVIEIQGDQRARVTDKLKELNYVVKVS